MDSRETARDLAKRCGADLVLDAGEATAAEIREATDGLGADVVLDFVGSDSTLALAAAASRSLADISIVGLGGGVLPVSFFGVPYEASVQTTYWGNRFELVEVLDLAARGLIRAEITRFNLDWSAVAYAQLAKGSIDGRAVVVPNERYRS